MKAFPNMTGEKGMDLRDYFAAAAMQAIIGRDHSMLDAYTFKAIDAIADARMEARENETDK